MYPTFETKRLGSAPGTDNGNGLKKEHTKDGLNGSNIDIADPTAFVDRYAGFVYWLSLYMTGAADDAEDILQKTFLAAQSGFTGLKQNESVVMRLARIAIDESFAKLRDRDASRLLRVSLEAETQEAFVPHDVAEWRDEAEKRYSREELRAIVREAVEGLPPFSRVAFLLRDVAHLKPEEIAGLFHLSVPRLTSHLLRGRLQLREHLNKYFKSNLKEKIQTA
jgi:RNA polymerase sigma-70 factor, ECF subfamily